AERDRRPAKALAADLDLPHRDVRVVLVVVLDRRHDGALAQRVERDGRAGAGRSGHALDPFRVSVTPPSNRAATLTMGRNREVVGSGDPASFQEVRGALRPAVPPSSSGVGASSAPTGCRSAQPRNRSPRTSIPSPVHRLMLMPDALRRSASLAP